MPVGDVAAAVGYFWVGGLGDGYAVGCGEAIELGLAWGAGFVDPGADARDGGGDVSGGGSVSGALGDERSLLVGGNVLKWCCCFYWECLGCGFLAGIAMKRVA